MFDGPVTVSKTSLNLQYDTSSFVKDEKTGKYLLHCECAARKISLTLELTPQKPPTRQAHNGIVKIGLKQDVSNERMSERVNTEERSSLYEAWWSSAQQSISSSSIALSLLCLLFLSRLPRRCSTTTFLAALASALSR
jgi:hypothetical protein